MTQIILTIKDDEKGKAYKKLEDKLILLDTSILIDFYRAKDKTSSNLEQNSLH